MFFVLDTIRLRVTWCTLQICGTGYLVTCADLRSPRIFGGHSGLIHVAANAFFYECFGIGFLSCYSNMPKQLATP
jgi:hypothetical protein